MVHFWLGLVLKLGNSAWGLRTLKLNRSIFLLRKLPAESTNQQGNDWLNATIVMNMTPSVIEAKQYTTSQVSNGFVTLHWHVRGHWEGWGPAWSYVASHHLSFAFWKWEQCSAWILTKLLWLSVLERNQNISKTGSVVGLWEGGGLSEMVMFSKPSCENLFDLNFWCG